GSVISHTGTWINAGICNLYSPVQSSKTSGCQGINGDDNIRSGLLDHTSDNFHGLHSGLGHNSWSQAAYAVDMFLSHTLSSILVNNMPCNTEVCHYVRPQSIRRDIPVSQAYHQHFHIFLLGNQCL